MSFNSLFEPVCVDLVIRYGESSLLGACRWLRQIGTVQDRRPITPPPCIRLIVQDAITRKKIDIRYVVLFPLVCDLANF